MALVWGVTTLDDGMSVDHGGMLEQAQCGCESMFDGENGNFVMLCGEPSGPSGQTSNVRVGTFGPQSRA
jgi:hypothetical protein